MSTIDMSELVTRAILKDELNELKDELKDELERAFGDFKRELDVELDAKFTSLRREIQADTLSAIRMIQGDLERNLGLALEPTKDLPDRVKKLETLPERVDKLEAKVFPPKRASRRR